MDITMYSAQQRKLFQEVFGKLNVNGFAIGAVKHRKENPTCQDIINQKNARRYLQGATTNVHEAMYSLGYTQPNVMSQETFKLCNLIRRLGN